MTKRIVTRQEINEKIFNEEKREPWKYWFKLIEEAELLARENLSEGNLTIETFDIPEYTSLCPRSWLPDFASIKILYVPNKLVIDEVSLKLYINKFRTFRGWHETTVNELIEDIFPLIEPKYLMVVWNFSIRGNVKTIPLSEKWNKDIKKKEKEEIQVFWKPYLNWFFNKIINNSNLEF